MNPIKRAGYAILDMLLGSVAPSDYDDGAIPQDPTLCLFTETDDGTVVPLIPIMDSTGKKVLKWVKNQRCTERTASGGGANCPPPLPTVPGAPTAGQPQFNPAAAVGL